MFSSAIVCGIVSDFCMDKKYFEVTFSRKLFTTLAMAVPGAILIVITFTGCNTTLAVVLWTLGITFMGAIYSGVIVNILDISPNFSGIIVGVSFAISSAASYLEVFFRSILPF